MINCFLQTRIIIAFSVLFCCVFMLNRDCAAAQEFMVIVNKSLSATSVSSDDVGNIFLGKKSTWNSGEKVFIAIYDDKEIQTDFLKRFVRKTPTQFRTYWKKMVFTGKGSMPQYLKTTEDVLAFIEKHPGAISFIPVSAADVKTLTIK